MDPDLTALELGFHPPKLTLPTGPHVWPTGDSYSALLESEKTLFGGLASSMFMWLDLE